MIDSEKIYLCTTDDPRQAAQLYDYVIIQAKGLGSKINFNYSKAELLAVLFEKSIVQVKKQKTEHDKIEQQKLFGFNNQDISMNQTTTANNFFNMRRNFDGSIDSETG